jgi:hypothetical protein
MRLARLPRVAFLLAVVGLPAAAGLAAAPQAEPPKPPRCEPWTAVYAGGDAAGDDVLALWQFDAGAETEDTSGHGHTLTLEGAKLNPAGKFAAALECFCGYPVEDRRHRAVAKNDPRLTPKGPFSLELWINPKPELNADYPDAFLLDKKYVAHSDYQLILGAADKTGARMLRAELGFGEDSDTWRSRPLKFPPGQWRHVAFVYDGEGGGWFFVDGAPAGGKQIVGRGAIAPGKHPLSIGDRIGSLYHGFPGLIDQVRIARGAREFRRLKLELISDRSCFVRMEKNAGVRLRLTNLDRRPLTGVTVRPRLDDRLLPAADRPQLAPGESLEMAVTLDTALRPDRYELTVAAAAEGPEPIAAVETFPVQIVARRPMEYPVLMWGVYGNVLQELPRLKEIGFTHVLALGADYQKIWQAGGPTEPGKPEAVATSRRMLDQCLAEGITCVASLSPGSAMHDRPELHRIDRQGKPGAKPDVCALSPALTPFCEHVGASVARAYGRFPAFGAALLHTEVRDHGRPCFHPHDREAFKQATGLDIPAEVAARTGVDYRKLPGFPADRVIADDHPLDRYYRWYWQAGDGWNGLNTALHRGLKSAGRDDLWTFHDPAARVACVYGSGGDVDVLSHWTYSYPDPIRIAEPTDRMLTMAAAGKQQVMKMTQIIWYRSQTAPEPKPWAAAPAYQAAWEREQPDAPFITIAPLHLREAFWTKIARPIRGIMYHGWQSLVPCEAPGGYRYTHPQTRHELARLVRDVVRPLGPTLLSVPGVPSDVAFLESFASEMFARRGTYGWGGNWAGDAYHAMLYAHLQPEIVFDETIAARGLAGFRVLVMPDCDVLTRTVVERIHAFQKSGGLVVGDENTCPAIQPDIRLTSYKRIGRADEDKRALLQTAAELRKQLDARYRRYADTSNPEIVPYLRRAGESDYLFLVNDTREFGQYVGQHGLVMENGLPAKAEVSLRRPAGSVYDLVERRELPARAADGQLRFTAALGPCDGRLLLISPRPIASVEVKLPEGVARGEPVRCAVAVVAADGRPLDAVVPLHVEICDSEGRAAERSGYHAAAGGRLDLTLDIAANDTPGVWQVRVRELASGRVGVGHFRVAGPTDWPPRKPASPELANPVQPKG